MTCTKGTGQDLFARDAPDMGYQSLCDVMRSLLPLVTHMQNLSYKCYVYIKKGKLRVYTKVQHNTNQISGQNY